MFNYPTINFHYCDVLIIGSGGSGLTAANYAATKNMRVIVVSKVHPMQSHTIAAQGGINAALGNITEDDPIWHMYDTIKASDWLADQDSVEMMCMQAPEAIKMLEQIGVHFSRTGSGVIDQKTYGGQSTHFGQGDFARRACYSADRTGQSIMEGLYKDSLSKNVIFLNYNFAIDLIVDSERCFGLVTWDIENGLINVIYSPHTIIATGGCSQIYQTATSSSICTGDGNGLAVRAGVDLQDMEFTQFHPTGINEVGVLITEAARSAGGILLNNKGERFMLKYAPKFLELASRDIIARSIATEISLGNGCGLSKDHVLLDLTHLSEEYIKTELPTVFENCRTFLGINPAEQPIPVAPAAHYSMGGIPTNSRCQVIKFGDKNREIKGLYAIGEAACTSVHGASRLGCNSLLDLIVFAIVAVDNISVTDSDQAEINPQTIIERFINIFEKKGNNVKTEELISLLRSCMQKYVGVFRNTSDLKKALAEILSIKGQHKKISLSSRSLLWNVELQKYLELENLIISAESAVASALWRKESRGAHLVEEFPERNDKEFLCHTIYRFEKQECIARSVRKPSNPVHFFQPEKRIY